MTRRRNLLICLTTVIAVSAASLLLNPPRSLSHCQIPCGIYDDEARFKTLAEDIGTVEKSMKMIKELSEAKRPNYNQIVRWIMNKDKHADQMSEIATYYFLAQRIKPVGKGKGAAYDNYVAKLTLLHQIVLNAMKAKQTTDLSYVEKLRSALAAFRTVYTHSH